MSKAPLNGGGAFFATNRQVHLSLNNESADKRKFMGGKIGRSKNESR